MNDEDIKKLAAQLTASLASKGDLTDLKVELKNDITELKTELKNDINRLEGKIDELDQKADTILEFAEEVDESTHDLTCASPKASRHRRGPLKATARRAVGVSSLDRTSSGVGKPTTSQSGFSRDKTVTAINQRVRKVESIPVIAHELRNSKS